MLTWHRFITIVVAVLVAVFLRLLLYRSRTGVAMRAVVDNRELAALHGVRPGRVSSLAWALGSSMAAIAGILLAPNVGLRVDVLTLFIVDAFAAAIIGRLRSLPWTFVGGLIIGVTQSIALNFLQWGGRWGTATTAIPAVILFVALLALPEARLEVGRLVPKYRVPKRARPADASAIGMAALVLVVVLIAEFGGLDTTNLRRLTLAFITALVMLSLVPLTGWAGQISLAQITFVGVGAFAMAEVAGDAQSWLGPGNPLGLLVAAAVAVPFGVLMALPALRLQGLYLALGVDGVRGDGDPVVLRATGDPRHERPHVVDATLPRHQLRRSGQLRGARGGRLRGARTLRRVVAARPLRSPAARAARQPGGQCHRRREPGVDQAARVRAGRGDGRVRGRAARDLPRHRRQHRLRHAARASRSCCCSWSAASAR